MRFGANLLRGAQRIPDPNGGPISGTSSSSGGGPSLGALAARYKTPALIGAAGLVVVLGMRHRASATSAPASSPLPGMGTDVNGATVAGYTPADSTGTDVYNAIQPQLEQTQGMLSQLLDALAALPAGVATVVAPTSKLATTPRRRRKPKPKPRRRPKARRPVAHRPPRRRVAPAGPSPARRAAAPAPHKVARDAAHVVRRGETAQTIAARYGTNPLAIARANSRYAPARVVAGRRIVVPNPRVRRA